MITSPHLEGLDLSVPLAQNALQAANVLGSGCTVSGTHDVGQSFNNKVYRVQISHASGAECHCEATLRDRQLLALRLTRSSWPAQKILNEVSAVKEVQCRVPDIPVPLVFAFSSEVDPVLGCRWIAQEWITGRRADQVWPELDTQNRLALIRELAGVVARLQQLNYEAIGGLVTSESKQLVGPFFDLQAGPFPRIKEWLLCQMAAKQKNLDDLFEDFPESHCLQPWCSKVTDAVTTETIPPDALRSSFVLVHGDFTLKNVLLTPDGPRIAAVLDWEWAGAFPPDHEWRNGLDELEQVAMGDGSSALTAFHKELAAAGGKCMADITGGAERGEVVGAMEAVPPWELAFVPRDRVPHLVEQSIKTLQSLQWL